MKNNIFVLVMVVFFTVVLTTCTHEEQRPNKVFINAVVDVDGNNYDAVQIGDQVWMKTNLRTTHFRDGSEIPIGEGGDIACYGDNYDENAFGDMYGYDAVTKGLFYNWSAVADQRGLCPEGWHVPNNEDWIRLESNLSQSYGNMYYDWPVVKSLASRYFWKKSDEPGAPGWRSASNDYTGFSVVPQNKGTEANFWSSTEDDDTTRARKRSIIWSKKEFLGGIYDSGSVYSTAPKSALLSIRCLRDPS